MSEQNETSVQASVVRQLVRAAVRAFAELDVIRARDGVPYDSRGCIDQQYFSSVIDALDAAVKAATGKSAHCHPELYDNARSDRAEQER